MTQAISRTSAGRITGDGALRRRHDRCADHPERVGDREDRQPVESAGNAVGELHQQERSEAHRCSRPRSMGRLFELER